MTVPPENDFRVGARGKGWGGKQKAATPLPFRLEGEGCNPLSVNKTFCSNKSLSRKDIQAHREHLLKCQSRGHRTPQGRSGHKLVLGLTEAAMTPLGFFGCFCFEVLLVCFCCFWLVGFCFNEKSIWLWLSPFSLKNSRCHMKYCEYALRNSKLRNASRGGILYSAELHDRAEGLWLSQQSTWSISMRVWIWHLGPS